MTRLARFAWLTRCALGWIAPYLRLQFDNIEEDVGLTAEFVRDHRRLRRDRRYDGHPHAAALHRFDQRAEVAVA